MALARIPLFDPIVEVGKLMRKRIRVKQIHLYSIGSSCKIFYSFCTQVREGARSKASTDLRVNQGIITLFTRP